MENNIIDLEEIAKAEARRYKAEWRKKNKELVRASNQRYWLKKLCREQNRKGRR